MKTTGFFSMVLLLGIISCNSGSETSQAKEHKSSLQSEKLNELSPLPLVAGQDTLAVSPGTLIPAQDPNSFYWGIIDSVTGKVVLDYKYQYIYSLPGSSAFVFLDNHWGLVDKTGKVLAEPFHSNVNYLQHGYVEMECYSGKGLFNNKGKQLFPYQHNEAYKVLPALNRVAINNGQYGALMDLNGKAIIPYDSHYTSVTIFPEGICVAWKNVQDARKAAIFDLNGKMIYPLMFDQVGNFQEGRMMVKRNKQYGFLDEKANIVFYRHYDRVDDYHNGFARVMKNQRMGFVNKAGKEITPVHFLDASVFNEGYAPVRSSDNYGFIDANGTTTVPFKYQGAENFREGIAFVWHRNGDYGVINYKGEEIIPVQYKELRRVGMNRITGKKDSTFYLFDFKGKELGRFQCEYLEFFTDDLCIVSKKGIRGALGADFKIQLPVVYEALEVVDKNALFARKDGKAHFIDFRGNVVSPIEFTYFEHYNDGVAKVTLKDKTGLINLSRKLVTPIKYDYIGNFEYGLAIIERKEKVGLIDYSGKEILPPVYDNITVSEHEIKVEKNGESFYVDRQGKRLEDEEG